MTPTEYFTTKFREIFTETKITHTSGAESNKWLSGPKMSYWPQQLNFAFWCASTCSGISRDLINSVPEQVKSFLFFTFISRQEGFSSKWVEFRVKLLFPEIQHSLKQRINTMSSHIKESAQNLEFLQTRISDLRKVLVAVLERFSFMRQILDQWPQNILTRI